MYIVTSKPKRMSEYSGLVHIINSSLIIKITTLNYFKAAKVMLHLAPIPYVRNTRHETKDFP